MNATQSFRLCAALLFGFFPQSGFSASRKPICATRFHMEVRASSEDPFSIPVKLRNPERNIYIESAASLSERQVASIYPFPASDGSWGCLFQLDASGRLTLSNLSASNRGRLLLFYFGTEKGSRPVLDILIDGPVNDGLLPVRKGLTWGEVELLKKRFPERIPQMGRP